MTKISPKIVFFGSGPVAAESLKLLLKDFDVEAVITKPTTEHEMRTVSKDVPVILVKDKTELDTLVESQNFTSSVGILIDFGIIVSKKLIDSFQFGIVNSHFSVLPEWRGADPISFAILSRQDVTGVSIMRLVEAMDEGPLLGYGEQPLNGTENATTLTSTLIKLSHALLLNDIPLLLSGESKGVPQSITERAVSYSRKLSKQDGILDFNKSAKELEAEVRAFIEWPRSRTEIAGKDVVILKALCSDETLGKPGEIFKTEDKKIGIRTTVGTLIIDELKPAGKNAMSATAFLAGYGRNL